MHQIGTALYGLGAIGLGMLSVVAQDFRPPIPDGLPGWAMPTFGSGLSLAAAGMLALWASTRPLATPLLALVYAVWAVGIHLPRTLGAPASVSGWIALAELLALVFAGIAAASAVHARRARLGFGLCIVAIGLGAMLGPVPAGLAPAAALGGAPAWAALAGASLIAAGAAISSGRASELPFLGLAALFGAAALLAHLPHVLAGPSHPAELAAFCLGLALSGAALMVRPGRAPARGSTGDLPSFAWDVHGSAIR